jgi:23S rRNA (pseudouridine1915-N3)-methyltransferase
MKILFLFGGGKWDNDALLLKDSYTVKIARTASIEERLITGKGKTPDELRDGESTAMLITMKPTDYVIVFDERGKKVSSEKFAELLERAEQDGKRVVVAVGGAYGMNDEVRARAQNIVAFSDMIFPHDLARIMAMEQVYRGLAIQKGSPYHHAN